VGDAESVGVRMDGSVAVEIGVFDDVSGVDESVGAGVPAETSGVGDSAGRVSVADSVGTRVAVSAGVFVSTESTVAEAGSVGVTSDGTVAVETGVINIGSAVGDSVTATSVADSVVGDSVGTTSVGGVSGVEVTAGVSDGGGGVSASACTSVGLMSWNNSIPIVTMP
jgi:hypothetical protein